MTERLLNCLTSGLSIFLRLSAEAQQRLEQSTTKSDNNNQWRSALPLGAAKKSVSSVENFIHKQYQYIQHLWCCGIVGAMSPSVIPEAINAN